MPSSGSDANASLQPTRARTLELIRGRLAESLHGADLPAAAFAARALVDLDPAEVSSWMTLANISARLGDYDEARRCARQAASLDLGDVRAAIGCIELLVGLGDRVGAAEAATRATPCGLGAQDADRLGALLTHIGLPQLALPFFERAVAASPTTAAFRFNLASAQNMVGAPEAAERNLDLLLVRDPFDGEAQLARSSLRRQTDVANHVRELELCAAQTRSDRGRIAAQYALAKELEDLGRYPESFRALAAGATGFRRTISYSVADDLAVLDALRPTPVCDAAPRDQGDRTIFIVGLPRSGTTLVDRVLATHSAVSSLGESNAFAVQTVTAAQQAERGRALTKSEFTKAVQRLDMGKLGRAYLEAVRPQTGRTPCFTDKTPGNTLYLDLIMRALPGASVVLVERHPVDSCYAMYKTLFSGHYPFSYDLDELGQYYVAWRRMVERWKAGFGERILTVRYENLVEDLPGERERIFRHCRLSPEADIGEFQSLSSPVTTASAAQVRQPLYKTSIGLWRRYEADLQPLIAQLVAGGIDLSAPAES